MIRTPRRPARFIIAALVLMGASYAAHAQTVAIVNVNLIPLDREHVEAGQTVVVRGDRKSVGAQRQTDAAQPHIDCAVAGGDAGRGRQRATILERAVAQESTNDVRRNHASVATTGTAEPVRRGAQRG